MANTKYDKHLIPVPLEQGNFAPVVRFSSSKHFGQNISFTMVRNCIPEPYFAYAAIWESEGITAKNDNTFGLAASVWTRD